MEFLNCSNLNDTCLQAFSMLFKPLLKLKEFGFTLFDCPKVKDEGVTSILTGIKGLKTLESLRLDISQNRGVKMATASNIVDTVA
jgi:hypothetical protein